MSEGGIGLVRLLPNAELLNAIRAHEIRRRQLEVESHVLIAELESRGLAFEHGCRDTATLLGQLLRLSPGEAKARVAAARDLGPRQSVTGEELEPIFPAVAAAQAEGVVSAAHARVVIDMVEKIPPQLRAAEEDAVEAELVEHARHWPPATVAQLGQRILAHLDPDGTLESLEERHRQRYVHHHERADGTGYGRYEADAELCQFIAAVLEARGAPQPDPNGTPDPRSAGQRNHDAMLDALQAGLRAGDAPTHAGVAVTVLLRASADDWAAGTGIVQTGTGASIPTPEAQRWASGSDTRFLAVLVDSAGRQISYSSCQRLFTEQQRLVLAERDHGCSFPGCTAPPAFTQAHHILDWANGGPTSVDNGTLLCRFHHRSFEQIGWTCALTNGRVHWTPPAWLDPNQQPLVNTAHDPP